MRSVIWTIVFVLGVGGAVLAGHLVTEWLVGLVTKIIMLIIALQLMAQAA